MAFKLANNGAFSVKAYTGDNKTLLAFNFGNQSDVKNLAGFSIQCQPQGQPAYYLFNQLGFADPSKHAQVAGEPENSTANSPIQKFRWTHVPATNHQGLNSVIGNYTYTVTPRFFDANGCMLPLDKSRSAAVTVNVGPFTKGSLSIGFSRGYMQSEAFLHHFGANTPIKPNNGTLLFDTSSTAGTNSAGQRCTFQDIYEWMGSTARQQVFNVLTQVQQNKSLTLEMFAYDLDEPDILKILLQLAGEGRLKLILDNAKLHTNAAQSTPEDQFTTLFNHQAKSPAAILRGCFARYSHDKILIVSRAGSPVQVLTGSTNFSVTGLYVNANHVLVFSDANVATHYHQVFEESWKDLTANPSKGVSTKAATAFSKSPVATAPYAYQSPSVPRMSITFSPHTPADTKKILGALVTAINGQAATSVNNGSVLFAVMQLTGGTNPVYDALCKIHNSQQIFSYGISDAPGGTSLYSPGSKNGVLVTGKTSAKNLPPPFDQLPTPPGHEIHDKFVVCGLNGTDPVVYCGSSNLASGGEQANGDNLLQIHDADVATVFAIEALLLVDHYNFLDKFGKAKASAASGAAATKKAASIAKAKKSASTRTPAKKAAKKAPKKAAKRPAKKAVKKAAKKSTKGSRR